MEFLLLLLVAMLIVLLISAKHGTWSANWIKEERKKVKDNLKRG